MIPSLTFQRQRSNNTVNWQDNSNGKYSTASIDAVAPAQEFAQIKPSIEITMEKKTLYLCKANNDLISNCHCDTALVGSPRQMDCPWCGCGWLFICSKCGLGFTFARAEVVDFTWEELALQDLIRTGSADPTPAEIKAWIRYMKALMKHLNPGEEYVYIDGVIVSKNATNISFKGIYARHKLDVPPQVAALKDRSIIEHTLSNSYYWQNKATCGY